MVPIWVSDPMGLANPLRTASTPATKVVATAPMPGILPPNFPLGAWISLPLSFLVSVFALFCRIGIFRLLPYESSSLGELEDVRRTVMFSYRGWNCNQLTQKVENVSSTAQAGPRSEPSQRRMKYQTVLPGAPKRTAPSSSSRIPPYDAAAWSTKTLSRSITPNNSGSRIATADANFN